MQSGTDTRFDTYEWVNVNGVWRIQSTNLNGVKTVLPEGVIPARAPSRFDEYPDYGQWLKKQNFKDLQKNVQEEVSAR
jgi:hypothetical protein